MCLAVPGEIIEIFDTQARVRIMKLETNVNIQLIENPQKGEFIIIHAGCAIEKIDKGYYDELYNIFKNIMDAGENYEKTTN